MRQYLFFMVTWLGFTGLQAQGLKPFPTAEPDTDPARQWVIKFAPLSLVDPDNTIQFGIERLLGRRYSVQAEVGYGGQDFSFWDTSRDGLYTNKKIGRGRAEWRLYFSREQRPLGIYFAIEGLYKRINALEKTVNGIPCLKSPCVPGLADTAPVIKQVWGGHLKIGYQYSVSSENRLLVDVYFGLGARYRLADRPDLLMGIILEEPPNLFNIPPAFPVSPEIRESVSMGVKLGYAF